MSPSDPPVAAPTPYFTPEEPPQNCEAKLWRLICLRVHALHEENERLRARVAAPTPHPIEHRGDLTRIVKDIRAAETVSQAVDIAALLLRVTAPTPETPSPQESLLHPVAQVYFRAGLLACREYMARFVSAESPSIANSIRANWWPSLGPDFGPPRKLDFAEVTSGTFDTPDFRVKTAGEVSPTQEALPIALDFLELAGAVSHPQPEVKTKGGS